jgi:hypothetical protein
MDYSNLIQEVRRYIERDYTHFPANKLQFIEIVNRAIDEGLASSEQLEQLLELKVQLEQLAPPNQSSFICSTVS